MIKINKKAREYNKLYLHKTGQIKAKKISLKEGKNVFI